MAGGLGGGLDRAGRRKDTDARAREKQAVTRTRRTTANAMIIPRNQPKLAVQAVFYRGQSILTPRGPSAMSRAKWMSSPVATPASTARCRRLAATATTTTRTVERE